MTDQSSIQNFRCEAGDVESQHGSGKQNQRRLQFAGAEAVNDEENSQGNDGPEDKDAGETSPNPRALLMLVNKSQGGSADGGSRRHDAGDRTGAEKIGWIQFQFYSDQTEGDGQ